MVNKHCKDSGAVLKFVCEECGRKFTTKQGCNRHKTVAHKKEKDPKELNQPKVETLKRERSVEDQNKICSFK